MHVRLLEGCVYGEKVIQRQLHFPMSPLTLLPLHGGDPVNDIHESQEGVVGVSEVEICQSS